MSKRAVPKPPYGAARRSTAAAVPSAPTLERKVRDRLPQALPILRDEAAILDRLLGAELARLFGDQ